MTFAMRPISTATVRSAGPAWRHDIQTGRHALAADEPEHAGGQDAGPAPYDLVLSGLGACTAITLQMYAQRKGWELGDLQVELTLLKNRDDETHIQRVVKASAALTDEQWARLLEIAGKTPVTRTLQAGATITTRRAD